MYTVVTRGFAALAAVAAVVYITLLVQATEDGPAGTQVSYPASLALVATIAISLNLAVLAAVTRSIVRAEIASLAHALTKSLAKATAEKVNATNHGIIEEVAGLIDVGLKRAHTDGMIVEAAAGRPNGTVSSIGRRGD